MTEHGATALPDPGVLEGVALAMIDTAPDGWTEVYLVVWYEAADVYGFRMWVEGPDLPRLRVRPPSAHRDLASMRTRQIAEGQEPWQRCDLRVSRAPGPEEPEFTADFAHEVGEIPA